MLIPNVTLLSLATKTDEASSLGSRIVALAANTAPKFDYYVASIAALPAHSVRRNQANSVAQQQASHELAQQEAAKPAKAEAEKAQAEKVEKPAAAHEVAAKEKAAAPAKVEAGKAANGAAEAKPAEEAAGGEEEKLAGEKEIESAFAVAVPLEGGDIKQGVVFTPSAIGKFEFEFQGPVADELTGDEKTTDRNVYLDTKLSVQVLAPRQQERRLYQAMDYIDTILRKKFSESRAKL